MAVVQAVFKHRRAQCRFREPPASRAEDFTYQFRRLVLPEARVWETPEDLLLEWGDPAHAPDVAALRQASLEGRPYSVFGRSWLHYHRPSHRLSVAVDKLGLFPVLLAQYQGSTYLASDTLALSQLLGELAQPAPEALLELLAYGQLLGNQATLNGVLHLHAGSVCTLPAQGNFHLEHLAPNLFPSQPGSEEQALEALVAAMGARLQQDPEALLLLSGDLDARLLLAAAHAAGHRPDTLAFGKPDSVHLHIAGALADSVGANFYSAALTPQHMARARQTTAQLGGGEVPLHRAHLLMCSELITRTRGATLITAAGSGAYRGYYYTGNIPGFELLSLSRLKSSLMKNARHYVRDAFAKTLEPVLAAFPALGDLLHARLEQRLAAYQTQADNAAHYLDAIYLGERMRRREVAEQQLLARDYARSHPYLDPEVLHSLAALPAYWRAAGRFYRRAVERLSPRLAEVPWEPRPHPVPSLSARLSLHFGPPPADAPADGALQAEWPLAPWGETLKPLYQTLRGCALPEKDIRSGVQVLLNGPARRHALGVLGSYSAWLHSLPAYQTALAACAN